MMDNWSDYFYGEEAVRTPEEFERREAMYQAFKERLIEELDLVQDRPAQKEQK